MTSISQDVKTGNVNDKPYLCMKDYHSEGWSLDYFATAAEAVKEALFQNYGSPVVLAKLIDPNAPESTASDSTGGELQSANVIQHAGEKPFLAIHRSDYNFSVEGFATLAQAVQHVADNSSYMYDAKFARRLTLAVLDVSTST
jgi:hypothetical protein